MEQATLILDEQRRYFDLLQANWDALDTKANHFLGGTALLVAIAGFTFSTGEVRVTPGPLAPWWAVGLSVIFLAALMISIGYALRSRGHHYVIPCNTDSLEKLYLHHELQDAQLRLIAQYAKELLVLQTIIDDKCKSVMRVTYSFIACFVWLLALLVLSLT